MYVICQNKLMFFRWCDTDYDDVVAVYTQHQHTGVYVRRQSDMTVGDFVAYCYWCHLDWWYQHDKSLILPGIKGCLV